MMDPTDMALPAFIDPILDYLSDKLPQPLYATLVNVLTHSLALFTASIRLFSSLLSKDSLEWNAQALLPPIISLLAAYLALASLYRTTTWMFRTSIWFIKWGIILGALLAGTGWLAAVTNMNNGGVISGLGSVISSWTDGGRTAASRSKTTSRTPRTKVRKYKPWESFEQTRDWQYQEAQSDRDDMTEAQKIMQNIVDTANQVFDTSGWWQILKGAAANAGGQGLHDAKSEKTQKQKGTSRTRSR